MLHHVLQFKRKAKRHNNKNVKHNLHILAQNGSGFDSYVVVKNLAQGRTVLRITKNG